MSPTWWHLLCAPPIFWCAFPPVLQLVMPKPSVLGCCMGLPRCLGSIPIPRDQLGSQLPQSGSTGDRGDAPCLEVASDGVFTRCVHGGLVGC